LNALVVPLGGTILGCIPNVARCLVAVATSSAEELAQKATALGQLPGITAAFTNVQTNSPTETIPLSQLPCSGEQCHWYLKSIRAPEAWRISGGGDSARGVAVIDFGVNCALSLLGCANDQPATVEHGTGVAALVGAKPNQETGTSGVAWNTSLHPLNLLKGDGSQYKMSELIAHSLTQAQAKIINISAGAAADSNNLLRDSLCQAADQGRLSVVAAGNPVPVDGLCESKHIYPARFASESQCSNGADLKASLLVAGALDQQNRLAQWQAGDYTRCSNLLHATIYAPGQDVLSLNNNNTWSLKTGTSYATPLVSGAAALVWAANPQMTAAEVQTRLLTSAATLSANSADARTKTPDARLEGKRLLDTFKAVNGATPATDSIITPQEFTFAPKSAPAGGEVTSEAVALVGITGPSPISIQGGY
ncbi:MAG TPA: S8 family serine peptidase, partial [Cellvibrionaceae bacterium]|nr:S8 family serine peptidase [Cellvibrionaceae bacterium]